MKRVYVLIVTLTLISNTKIYSKALENGYEVNFSEVTKLKMSTKMPIGQVWPRGTENNTMYAYIPPYYEGKVVFATPKKYRKRYIATISSDLQVTKYNELVLNKDDEFNEVIWFNNTLCVFSKTSTKDMSKNVLSVNTVNKNDLNIENDRKELIRVNYNSSTTIQNIIFKYRTSPDSSKLLITYHLEDKEHNILSSGLAVFDNNFNEIWADQSLEFNLGIGAYLFDDFKVDNSGNVFVHIDVYESKKELENVWDLHYGLFRELGFTTNYLKQSPNYTSHMVCLINKGKSCSSHNLSSKDKKIRYLAFEPHNDKLICVGLYSNKGQTSIVGASYIEINPYDNAILKNINFDYELEYLLNGLNEKEAAKTKELYMAKQEFENGLYNVDLKIREDGGFWFLAEHLDISKDKMPGGPQKMLLLNCYHYKDISVLSFNENGDILWKEKIDKLAFTTFEQIMYGSFSSHVNKDELVVFYNQIDRKRNALWDYKAGTFEVSRFNKDGLKTTTTLSNVKEQEVIVQPFNIGQFSNNSLFFSGQETLKNRFLNITVNKD